LGPRTGNDWESLALRIGLRNAVGAQGHIGPEIHDLFNSHVSSTAMEWTSPKGAALS
jgi:hypothetical protein